MFKTRAAETRGSALLAVLWLSAALAAIAFSVASSVRAETERASTESEGLRAYYLATGSIERGILWIFWGSQYGGNRYYHAPMPWIHFTYPSGAAAVEVIPESSKLNVNTAKAEDLIRLMAALGVEPERAQAIARGIIAWRAQGPEGSAMPALAPGNSLGGPTFAPPHASFQEIEELLFVPGMTPDLFYGSFGKDPQGHLIPRPGLKDCLSVYGMDSQFDINTASPALLQALGLDPAQVAKILAVRSVKPFHSMVELAALGLGGPGFQRLGVGGGTVWTLRATAYPRLANGQRSDVNRTVSATVKFLPPEYNPQYQYLRWYDDNTSVRFTANPGNPEARFPQ